MEIYKEVTIAHLKRDLTQFGVIYNIINLLAVSLQNIISGGEKNIHIDCESIRKADIRGLQMLYVWMQSAKTRGVEPELINLSDSMRESIKSMGFEHCFTSISAHKLAPVFIKRQDKIFFKRERRREIC